MSATEIHNFLVTRPGVAAMRKALADEGVTHYTHATGYRQPVEKLNKPDAELALLKMMEARKGG